MTLPTISILFVGEKNLLSLKSFLSYLRSIGCVRLSMKPGLHVDLSVYDVVITVNGSDKNDMLGILTRFVESGGGWVEINQSAKSPLPLLFGVRPRPLAATSELRVMFRNKDNPLAARMPEAIYIKQCSHGLERLTDEVQTILYADWRYQHIDMLVSRAFGDGNSAVAAFQDLDHPVLHRVLYRLMRQMAGHSIDSKPLGVGILGYAPSVGRYHGLGIESTSGLWFRGACDSNPKRQVQAREDFPHITTYKSAKELASDPELDVVIIATPPNTHAKLALQMMDSGKHVVCEKPLALNRKETTALVEMSNMRSVHLSCHQNRRWDVDYMAIKQAIGDGLIGDLFYMETFVGGFNHPCGYWHSHDVVSGGTAYDWGGHYLDWIVSLIPERITSVTGTRQNRVWHDVTNADQERVQIRFESGKEAEFIHSDIAAARKPKWYLLGTEGAIVGHWCDVTTYTIDPVVYFHRHDIPATEMPPDIVLYSRTSSGQITKQNLCLPDRLDYPFHANLADHLLLAEPIEAPLADSLKVVAILEAASRSAAKGGSVEVLDG
ncbi:MAG: Gfo/Idh/MocA family oxidoreductase [Deltaproteobacteria bacterium]|nr:Gfo/Idh/MocA family oxidoreductase [Deltaproteobacteria bacterium]MBW2153668.1 Gfo/Idh/MocA family oxidoreductase [Deltaproteobacteria bacterium]